MKLAVLDKNRLFEKYLFGILVALVAAINIPYFKSTIIPRHDTMHYFEVFHFFYSNLLFNGELAQWMPFDTFGLPSNHDHLAFISPVIYCVFLIGYVFKITNVLLLFKVALLVEQCVFLLGMYLLSSLLFAKRSTIFILCLAAACSVDLYDQIFFDFKIFYLLPLALYFLLRFFAQKKPHFLWLTGLTLIAWVMGSVLYFFPLWLFVLAIPFLILFLYDPSVCRCLFQRSFSHIALLVVLVVVALGFYHHLKEILNFVDLRPRGPDGKNALGMFLTWSSQYNISHFYEQQIFHNPATRYIGLLPVFFFVWAILKVRDRIFFVFLITTVALWWFSTGGIFSTICYFFPGMPYYRHIGLVGHVVQILLLMCAGFGWEHFWSASRKTKIRYTLIILAILLFLADAFHISGDWIMDFYMQGSHWKALIEKISLDRIVVRYFGYLAALFVILMALTGIRISKKIPREWLAPLSKAVLITAFLFDIFSAQLAIYKSVEKLSPEYEPLLYTLNAHPMKFQESRMDKPIESRQKDAYRLITRPEGGHLYSAAYSFLQFDSCFSEFNTHMLPLGFARFTKTRRSIDTDFLYTIGCHAAKIRLISQAVYPDTVEQTMSLMRTMPQLYNVAVLRGVDEKTKQNFRSQNVPAILDVLADIKKFSANKLSFDIDVPREGGAWLVYADSYHPGWKAFVDGTRVSIFEAYLNFKSLYLTQGHHNIQFIFSPWLSFLISYGIAVWGLGTGIVLIVGLLWVLFAGVPEASFRHCFEKNI